MIFLDPRNDVAFKKIFGSDQHKNITISFLNALLEYTGDNIISDVQFLNTEQHPMIIKEKKDNILDILCTDQAKKQYIIEMQVEPVKEFGNRMVYYGSKTYAMQLGIGKSYRELTPVIIIAITNFNVLPKSEGYKSIHKIQSTKTEQCHLNQLTFVFAELKKFTKQEDELVIAEDKWFYFIKEIAKKAKIPKPLSTKEFKDACQVAERMKWSEAELNAYDDAFVKATDLQGAIELAEERGEARGEAKGQTKGEVNKAIKIATSMLRKGIKIEAIAELTELSVEDIKKIK